MSFSKQLFDIVGDSFIPAPPFLPHGYRILDADGNEMIVQTIKPGVSGRVPMTQAEAYAYAMDIVDKLNTPAPEPEPTTVS